MSNRGSLFVIYVAFGLQEGSRDREGAEFQSGEEHMCHSIQNLEHHHFKYDPFRQPGDLHAHFFGTPVISYADGVDTEMGDQFELEASAFGRALRNEIVSGTSLDEPIDVQGL